MDTPHATLDGYTRAYESAIDSTPGRDPARIVIHRRRDRLGLDFGNYALHMEILGDPPTLIAGAYNLTWFEALRNTAEREATLLRKEITPEYYVEPTIEECDRVYPPAPVEPAPDVLGIATKYFRIQEQTTAGSLEGGDWASTIWAGFLREVIPGEEEKRDGR